MTGFLQLTNRITWILYLWNRQVIHMDIEVWFSFIQEDQEIHNANGVAFYKFMPTFVKRLTFCSSTRQIPPQGTVSVAMEESSSPYLLTNFFGIFCWHTQSSHISKQRHHLSRQPRHSLSSQSQTKHWILLYNKQEQTTENTLKRKKEQDVKAKEKRNLTPFKPTYRIIKEKKDPLGKRWCRTQTIC